jgi:hypothetical protein
MQHKPKLAATSAGSIRFDHPCHICGKPAAFGSGVDLTKFIALHLNGVKRYELLGTWTCGHHRGKTA